MDQKQRKLQKAVALRYDMEQDSAPMVVASGKGDIAEKILEKARELDIPIKEDKDLVEVLAYLNIGEEIPVELYQVIAEILSFFYSMEDF